MHVHIAGKENEFTKTKHVNVQYSKKLSTTFRSHSTHDTNRRRFDPKSPHT